jgi:ComF family protein
MQAKRSNTEAAFGRPFAEAQPVKRLYKALTGVRCHVITHTCVLCGQSAEEGRICRECRRILPWNDNYCDCCGQVTIAAQPPGVPCAACQLKRPPFEKARAPLIYDFPVDAALKAIKFKRQLWFIPAFAELLLWPLENEFPRVDALVPVPLHRWRQMTRGFNQAVELCRPLRQATGLPMLSEARRIRATRAQTGLNATERKNNLKNAFAVCGKLRCRHPLIVDDVITTGETCSQLALTLLEAGAESVNLLTVARAV